MPPRPRPRLALRAACLLAALSALAAEAAAQGRPAVDTVVTWQTYSRPRQARVRVFASADEERPRTVVIDERAAGGGGPVTDEARYFVETVGRALGFDPAQATFVFRYTAAAFVPEGRDDGKALLLRATFRRGRSGDLASPQWRAITADELEDLTDRAMR